MEGENVTTQSRLRYLWAYSANDEWVRGWHQRLLERRRHQGFDVKGFCVTPQSVGGTWLHFPELDYRWRTADPGLMRMYAELAEQLQDRDVLVLYNGANLHPEFVSWLKVVKVYTAGDDPETTEILSGPLAPAFDIHLVNNVACVEMYRGWGLKRVHFWPLGSLAFEEDVADLTDELVLDVSRRPLPAVFFGERNEIKRERLDALDDAFPDAFCAGRGWARGTLSWDEMWATYRRAQVGWNLHNSTGPINFRLYDLAAHGVMQVCDNRQYLPQVYEVGREAAAFDTVDECIELTRYYLAHPEEQREIALAGRRRWERDYTPDRVWEKLTAAVESHAGDFALPVTEDVESIRRRLAKHARRGALQRQALRIYNSFLYRRERVRRRLFG